MFSGQAHWFLLTALSSSALLACGSDATPDNGGGAGMSSGGSAAGNQTGGSTSNAGTTSTAGSTSAAGTQSGGGNAGSSSTAGTGGAAAGSGGSGGAGGSGGSAGGAGGSGGSTGGGGAGGGAAMPTAVANIMGLGASAAAVAGTATFTQGATMTKMVLNLTACPNGMHASHMHSVKDCGDNGNAAGGHWVPNGEGLGDYTCADNKVTYEFSKPTTMWTIGDGSATDITKYSFMVHEMGGANPGGRIGCGLINKQ
jgi:hypothetical protein